MLTRRGPLYLLLLLLFAACGTDVTTGDAPSDVTQPDVNNDAPGDASSPTAQAVLDLVNAWRTQGCNCGGQNMPPVPALTLNSQLNQAASNHSNDQAAMRNMQHVGSDGSQVGERVSRTGYSWQRVGENIAWNYRSPEAVVDGWVNSAGHCRNMMNANYRHMGLAVRDWYWTQVFATPR